VCANKSTHFPFFKINYPPVYLQLKSPLQGKCIPFQKMVGPVTFQLVNGIGCWLKFQA
jgi:hypothetical protein